MFVCSPTSCPGVDNVDIDQNHQLWRSPPGSNFTEVWTCQLNPGQMDEANVCFNIAKPQGGLGSGVTPGSAELPHHTIRDRSDEIQWKGMKPSETMIEAPCWKPLLDLLNTWSDREQTEGSGGGVDYGASWWTAARLVWLKGVNVGRCQATYLKLEGVMSVTALPAEMLNLFPKACLSLSYLSSVET